MTSGVLTKFDFAWDLVFDPSDPVMILTQKSSRQIFWARLMMITLKMWPLECWQDFPLIWPSELVTDPKWPGFTLDLEIIKINILSTTDSVITIAQFEHLLRWAKNICGYSLPGVMIGGHLLVDSSEAVISYWWKYVQKYWFNHLAFAVISYWWKYMHKYWLTT